MHGRQRTDKKMTLKSRWLCSEPPARAAQPQPGSHHCPHLAPQRCLRSGEACAPCGQSEGRWLGEPPSAASAGTGWAAEGSRGRGEEGTSREARAGAASSGRAVRGPGAKWHRVPGVEMLSVFPTSNQAGAKVKENRLRAQNFRNNI